MTRLQLYLFTLFLFSPFIGIPQGEGNVWYFGNHAGLDFNSGLPLVLDNCSLMFQHPTYSTTVSDTAGNLLFYVDMSYIYNRNQQVMPNGSMMGMCMETYFQPSFAVRSMSSDSIWFLFTMGSYPTPGCPVPQGLRYNIVDMSLDGGLGDIPPGEKGLPIPGAELTARMLTGTRAQNNRDIWIVVRKFENSNEFITYHITNAGIDMNPVTSNSLITLHYPSLGTFAGMLRFSPDGTRLVATYDSVTEICHFNLLTGEITPMFLLKIGTQQNALPSAEFSIDNKFLYMGTTNYLGGTTIYQYDATKEDSAQFKQSEIMIHQNSYGSYLQRGPDHKIYCTHTGIDSIDVINHPSIQGSACGWQRGVLGLNGNYSLRGFIQTLQRYFVYITHSNHCQGQPVYFISSICPQPDSIHWDFGDPISGPDNFSNQPNPAHIFQILEHIL